VSVNILVLLTHTAKWIKAQTFSPDERQYPAVKRAIDKCQAQQNQPAAVAMRFFV